MNSTAAKFMAFRKNPPAPIIAPEKKGRIPYPHPSGYISKEETAQIRQDRIQKAIGDGYLINNAEYHWLENRLLHQNWTWLISAKHQISENERREYFIKKYEAKTMGGYGSKNGG